MQPTIRVVREEMPKPFQGTHRVRFVGNPERVSAYLDGAGLAAPNKNPQQRKFDYYSTFPDLIGFIDFYRDAETRTLYIGYLSVRVTHRQQRVGWTILRAMLAAYPDTNAVEFGDIFHAAAARMYHALRAELPSIQFYGKL